MSRDEMINELVSQVFVANLSADAEAIKRAEREKLSALSDGELASLVRGSRRFAAESRGRAELERSWARKVPVL